jgi:integrase
MAKRRKTNFAGVFYREVKRLGGKGTERVYYVLFKKDGKLIEEKAGYQYRDDMTPARAATFRAERIEGRRPSRRERREAEKAAKEAEREAEASRWTVSELWEHYKADKGKYATLKTDTCYLSSYINPSLGAKEPRDIVQLDVDRVRHGVAKKGKAPQTVRNVLELLRRITNYGVKKGLCQGLAFKIEMPKVNNLKTEDLTPEQLKRLLEAIDQEKDQVSANIVRLVLCTGMRRGECFKLQWEDVDFDRGFINLRDPKGKVDQKIPLNEAARALLESHPRLGSPYVFPNRRGGRRKESGGPIDRIRKAAGLPKGFRPLHGLRHTFASMLASSGEVDLYTLQKLLTHKSPQMTQRYAHLRDEALKKASNLAGNFITEAMEAAKEKAKEESA